MSVAAGELADIGNFRQYSEEFASAGQPSADQLQDLAQAGFKRVIYLAFSDDHTAIEREDRVVKELGMDYVQIPVDWGKPTIEDFEHFAALMNQRPPVKTFLHCQINLRASTFSFLYRVIYGAVPISQAKKDLDSVWLPNPTWFRFIVDVLESHGKTHLCDECDWAENEFES